jgi:predicted Fe-S protein YdhL (DUF1289 family)
VVESPCINDCAIADGKCVGCGRTEAEIFGWQTMTEQEQQQVVDRVDDST